MAKKINELGVHLSKNTPDGTAQPITIQQITVRPINRQSQDLTNWRNATKAAEALVPRRVSLYDLYSDITSTDGHIISVWSKRVDAITAADWEFVDKDGKPVEEINQLIDSIGFEDLLKAIINSKAWGYSMVEPTFFINEEGEHEFSIYDIPKKHMRPEKGIVAYEQSGDTGINIREGIYAKTVMEFGKVDDLGLLLAAAKYAILKRGDESDWAEFIEIFGRGIIDAQWDGFDENQRLQLSEALQTMGSGGILIRPAGTQIDIKQPPSNANGDLQASFAAYLNKEISKALLGSTETTESSKSSGYAQGKIHQDQDDRKNETDITFARRNLNSRFRKVLRAAGFDTKGGKFVIKKKKNLTKKERFEIAKSMKNDLKIPIDDKFFYEEFEIDMPEDYEAQKAALEAPNKDNVDFDTSDPNDKSDNTPPDNSGKKSKKPTESDSEEKQLSWLEKSLIKLGFSSKPRQDRGESTVSGELLWQSPHTAESPRESI